MYNTRLTKIASKSLKKIRREDQIRIIQGIEDLSVSPITKSNVKKLKASSHYRLRIGDYRILFDRDDTIKVLDIIDILHRRDAYKRG